MFWSIPSSFFFTFLIWNVANFWSSVVVNFNAKLKTYLYVHGSNNIVLVFVVSAYNTRCKKEKSWLFNPYSPNVTFMYPLKMSNNGKIWVKLTKSVTLAQLHLHACIKVQIPIVCRWCNYLACISESIESPFLTYPNS